ncbi:MAG: DUF11 domain-containing protein [Anaerolineales bacterium]|nr:DUF11 domain-containing protein [Anaerolineales bacterium]
MASYYFWIRYRCCGRYSSNTNNYIGKPRPNNAATNVQVRDLLPSGLTYVSHSSSSDMRVTTVARVFGL